MTSPLEQPTGTPEGLLTRMYAVPPHALGPAPIFETEEQEADYALAMAEAAGFDPYDLSEPVQQAAARRYLRWLEPQLRQPFPIRDWTPLLTRLFRWLRNR